jgi:hypothetical protein
MTKLTSFSTDNLRETIFSQKDLASPNRYRVELPDITGTIMPSGDRVSGKGNAVADRIQLGQLCTTARIPGKNISVVDRNIGLEQVKVANGYTLGEIGLTFYLTNKYSARNYFQQWMNCIVSPTPPFVMGFHANYAKDLQVVHLDRNGDEVYRVQLIKAYPTSISEMDLNNQAQSAAMELTVSLTYSNYFIK